MLQKNCQCFLVFFFTEKRMWQYYRESDPHQKPCSEQERMLRADSPVGPSYIAKVWIHLVGMYLELLTFDFQKRYWNLYQQPSLPLFFELIRNWFILHITRMITSTSSTWRTFSFCIGGIISPDILKRSGCQTLMSSRWKKEANSTILTREFMWTRPTLWLRRIHWHLVWWKCSWTCWCTVTCWWVSHLRRCTLDPWWLSLSFTLRSAPWQFISWVRNWRTSAGLESVAVEISGLNCGTSAGHNFFQTVLKCPQTYSISFIIVIFIFYILHYITLLYISFII